MQSENARGAILMMLGMAAFTLNDSIMKVLGGQFPLFQTLLWRGALVSVFLTVIAWRKGAFRVAIDGPDRWRIVLRSAIDTTSTWFFLQALYNMPLANLTAILQSLPLSVTLGAALFLGEPVGWRRLLAIAVGFMGVLMIVRPDAQGFDLYAIYALICMILVTARDLLTRRMSRSVPSLIVALGNAVAVTLFGVLGATQEVVQFPPLHVAGLLVGASVFLVGGYVMTVMAVRTGELGFVTPFRYTALVWAFVLGVVVFGDVPQMLTILGTLLIVATGLFTLLRERQLRAAKLRGPGPR